MKNIILLLVMFLVLTACTTVTPIEMSTAQIQKLNSEGDLPLEGRKLIILMNDGEEHNIKVISTTDTTIVTEKGEIPFSDISEIKIVELDKSKTAKGIGTGVLAYIALGIVVIANALDSL